MVGRLPPPQVPHEASRGVAIVKETGYLSVYMFIPNDLDDRWTEFASPLQ